jgi:hypothetical protein
MSLHSRRCLASTSCSCCLKLTSASCFLLRAARSQPLAAAAATTGIFRTSALCSTFSHWEHCSWHGILDSSSALVFLRPWWCSDVKLYSYRRCTQRAVWSSKNLKLGSNVRAERSVPRWHSCPYRYFWKCSNVFRMTSNSRRVMQ